MLLLSKTSEYALRAVVCLASHHGEPIVTSQLAELTRVPAGYLSKVLQQLGRGGLVQAQRGLHGGFSLARPPAEMTILDVLNAVDPVPRIRGCPLGLKSHGTNLCPLHRQLDDALASIEQAFAGSTLADLLNEPTDSPPLCEADTTANKQRLHVRQVVRPPIRGES
ncbi:Rrf2 family transcriptional regulator [Phycisphaerales bacterium AB-hyl4]|uniref:Rrf2 family transcriptional regulator n=1 Tax=Natronomicrosphaera hydrolytica TaxID=3242702 RepID=A0ABV4U6Z2_9BACT